MKLSYEDKVEIYELIKSGVSWAHLSQTYNVTTANLKYMIILVNWYGVEIIEKVKNTYYAPELKLEIRAKVYPWLF